MPVFHGWRVVGLAFLVATFGWGFGFYGIGVQMLALVEKHGWSVGFVSSGVTAYYLAGAVFIVRIGDAVNRFGPRAVVGAGALAMGLAVLILLAIREPWQLYAAFLVMAFGWSCMGGAAINSLVAPWFSRRRGLAVSLALTGASMGGMVIVPGLVALTPWLGTAGAFAALVALMWLILLPLSALWLHREGPARFGLGPDGDPPATSGQSSARPSLTMTTILKRFAFWTITVPFAMGLMAQVGFLTHQLSYLTPILGAADAAACVVVTTVAAMTGRLALGLLVDRMNRRLVAAANFAMQAAALGIMAACGERWALYATCVVFGAGVGNMITLPALIVQREFEPADFARVVALITAVNQVTFAFGPGLLGALRDWSGAYTLPLIVCAGLIATAAAVVLLGMRASPKPLPS